MFKYILKRIGLLLLTLFVIMFMCFVLIRMLPREMPQRTDQLEATLQRCEALGYNEPILTQWGIYLLGTLLRIGCFLPFWLTYIL